MLYLFSYFLFMVFITFSPFAAAMWIEDFTGNAADYYLIRQEKNLPIQYLLPLKKNDVLHCPQPHRLRLNIGNDSLQEIDCKTTPYFVTTITTLANFSPLWQRLSAQLTAWHVAEHEAKPLKIALSPPQPRLPALYFTLPAYPTAPEQILIAGKRSLFFAFAGGKSPYTLTLQQQEKTLWTSEWVTETRLSTAEIDLNAGNYQVILRDSLENVEIYHFTAVNYRPFYPEELAVLKLPARTHQLTQAVWLAGYQQGKWAFEAYQQIAPLAITASPAALLLRNALEQGVRVGGE